MKKAWQWVRIGMTNLKRIIIGLLFIDISPLLQNSVQATFNPPEINCYAAGPGSSEPSKTEVFLVIAPFVVVGIVIYFVIEKVRKKIKKNRDEKGESNDKKD